MPSALFELADILNAFKQKKVLTKEEILRAAGCSSMTAWRLLRRHGYFTSYNDNARYYTIVGIPKFDKRGLWVYRKARFSKWGSLTKTIVGLVEESASGLTADQLQGLLNLKNVKPVLTRLIQREALTRKKVGRRFVYLSVEQASGEKQYQQRQEEIEKARAARSLPRLEDIIALLVEIIRRPQGTSRQWVRRLSQQGIRMTSAEVEAVLDYYQIDRKKGLLNF